MTRVLPRSFFADDALDVAPQLLNKLLVHDDPSGERLAVRLVEVEAYRGAEDPGSHAYRGMTPRNRTMFGPAGHLYVYFSYGAHWCMNVVCGPDGVASAVLLRAGAPVEGIELMRKRRVRARRDRDLCSGPGKLTQALGIDRSFDGADLVRGALRVVDDGVPPPSRPGVSTRVGLGAGRGETHPWRFFVSGDPNVSRGPIAGSVLRMS
ncbi:MAG TPA: DNA-3-methyladenine glycosylase [Acidimicrobiia bacterium]|nr:DNA-3-methyladenine glycosylase [Acidimicrobiia bacterium]